MSKYIPAEKLIAEIERRIAAYQKNFDKADNKIARLSTDGRIASLKALLPFITSLQQEQSKVELEKFDKEVTRIWGRCAAEPNDSIACLHISTFNEIARHFWNKGYNARKEE